MRLASYEYYVPTVHGVTSVDMNADGEEPQVYYIVSQATPSFSRAEIEGCGLPTLRNY